MNSSRRILIISSGNPCRNPRPVKEADALGRAGFEVTLLTPVGDPSLAAQDRALCAGSPFRHESVLRPANFSRRCIQWFMRRIVPLGLEGIRAVGSPSALLRRARALTADLTIVHNEVPFWIGRRLIAKGRRVAADFEDWYSEDLLPEDRRHRPLRLLRKLEEAMLSHAVYTSTTSHALADALHTRYGGHRPQVITNSFPLQPLARPAVGHFPKFFWFSQTVGPGRGLEFFLDAWKLTNQPSSLVLLGGSRSGYTQGLLSQLPEVFRQRIQFLPLVSPAELPSVIAHHDIGLALEDPSIANRDLTITNKVLQYLNGGLAVVATNTAGQREVLAHSPAAGLIMSSHDPQIWAARLDALLSNPGELHDRRLAARQLAEATYCWERESPQLVSHVTAALAQTTPTARRESA